jgi:hypothetical protein
MDSNTVGLVACFLVVIFIPVMRENEFGLGEEKAIEWMISKRTR